MTAKEHGGLTSYKLYDPEDPSLLGILFMTYLNARKIHLGVLARKLGTDRDTMVAWIDGTRVPDDRALSSLMKEGFTQNELQHALERNVRHDLARRLAANYPGEDNGKR